MKIPALVCVLMTAALPAWSAEDAPSASSSLTLRAPPVIEAAPQRGQRFSVRARFAPVERAGDLREGTHFTLIGRFAKAGLSCDFTAVFSDGFEGP